MDTIFLSSNLKNDLDNITNIKNEYEIRCGIFRNWNDCVISLNNLFEWANRNNVTNLSFQVELYCYDFWFLFCKLVRNSTLKILTIHKSNCSSDITKFNNAMSLLLWSKVEHLTFTDDYFDNTEEETIYELLKNNYRLQSFKTSIRLPLVEKRIERNKRGWSKVKNAVYTLLLINKFTKVIRQPKDIIWMICDMVLDSVDDSIWYD